MGEIIARNMLS